MHPVLKSKKTLYWIYKSWEKCSPWCNREVMELCSRWTIWHFLGSQHETGSFSEPISWCSRVIEGMSHLFKTTVSQRNGLFVWMVNQFPSRRWKPPTNLAVSYQLVSPIRLLRLEKGNFWVASEVGNLCTNYAMSLKLTFVQKSATAPEGSETASSGRPVTVDSSMLTMMIPSTFSISS